MLKIKTYNAISPKGIALFDTQQFSVGPDEATPDAILLRSQALTPADIPASVKAIARAGAGTNNVPVDYCSEQGIVVFNTPGANANAVKELVLTGLLLSCRGIVPGIRFVESLQGVNDASALEPLLEAEKKRFKGIELAGKTLGIVGLGAIGSLVASAALELGMKVAGFDPALSVDAAWRISSRVQKVDSLNALMAQADFVTLHVPLVEGTRHLIDSTLLAQAKPGLRLLNFSRGGIVDNQAVLQALNDHALHHYITDFPAPELMGRDDVLALPHLGASTIEAEENCAVMAAQQLIDFLRYGHVSHSVNFPHLAMDRSSGRRVAFSNRNVPGVLGHVLAIFSDRGINVVDIINKSRADLAYNIADIEAAPDDGLLRAIGAVEGVINVRAI